MSSTVICNHLHNLEQLLLIESLKELKKIKDNFVIFEYEEQCEEDDIEIKEFQKKKKN